MLFALPAAASQRTTVFDHDPHWTAKNNTPSERHPCHPVRQSFGWTQTSHVSPAEAPGELGGELVASLRPASYAIGLRARSFDRALSASGRFVVPVGPATRYSPAANPGEGSASLGFFGPGSGDYRGRNAIGLRIRGHRTAGGRRYFVYLDVAGDRGQVAPKQYQSADGTPVEFVPGRTYAWALTYDPAGGSGSGAVRLAIDDLDAPAVVTELTSSMRREQIRLDHFGLRNQVVAGRRAVTWYVDDLTVVGRAWSFASDPRWQSHGSQRRYVDCAVSNRQDFGWRPGADLLGGRIWRTAPRGLGGLAWYADRLKRRGGRSLSLSRPLRAEGELALRRASIDSGFSLGWFSSTAPLPRTEGLRPGFVGLRIGSISRIGFLVLPTIVPLHGTGVRGGDGPRIVPRSSGFEHFSIAYDPPTSAKAPGRLTTTLGSRRSSVDVPYAVLSRATTLDRFGVITTLVGGGAMTFAIPRMTYTID